MAKDELRNKTVLLDEARREASEAISSVERLAEECRGLHGDLHQQVTLVAQRDEVIGRLRDEACTHWASGWLAFQRKAANVYPGLDFNFNIPSDEEAEESLSADYFGNRIPLLRSSCEAVANFAKASAREFSSLGMYLT